MSEISPFTARLGAELNATQHLLGVLLGHFAKERQDPTEYVLTVIQMLSPDDVDGEPFDADEEMIADAMQTALDRIERMALAIVKA